MYFHMPFETYPNSLIGYAQTYLTNSDEYENNLWKQVTPSVRILYVS